MTPELIAGIIFIVVVVFAVLFPRWWRSRGLQVMEEMEMPEEEAELAEEFPFLSLRNLGVALIGLLVAAGLIAVVAGALFVVFELTGITTQDVPPELQLQQGLVEQHDAVQATEMAQLEGYRWINEEYGVSQIPIERAMSLLADRGIPAVVEAMPTGVPIVQEEEGEAGDPGEALFQQLGCGGCHQAEDSPVAPTLVGIYGTEETLEGGETVTVDDEYLRESILNPNAHIVEGYQPIMPSYEGRVTDEQLEQLVEYIASLADGGS